MLISDKHFIRITFGLIATGTHRVSKHIPNVVAMTSQYRRFSNSHIEGYKTGYCSFVP